MAAVGSVTCTFVKGSGATAPRQRVQTWFAPGTDGQSALLLGANEGEFAFTCVLYDSLSNVLIWAAALEAVQGTVVRITDDFATDWDSCLVQEVSVVRRTPSEGSGVSNVEVRGEIAIRGVVVA